MADVQQVLAQRSKTNTTAIASDTTALAANADRGGFLIQT